MNKDNKNTNLIVESNPHMRSSNSTRQIMLGVIIATLPVVFASVYIFGAKAAVLIISCVCSCIFFEYMTRLLLKKSVTIGNLSAVVTGILLAFNLPVTIPIYIAVIGSFVAIVVAKEMFGGLGQNFANPAIVGRIVLMLSFPAYMNNYVAPFYYRKSVDVVTTATPMSIDSPELLPSVKDLLLGNHGGSLGETCSLAILIGFVILLLLRIIRPITPLIFVGTVMVGTFIAGGDPIFAVLSGGLLLGAIFMATDYSTNPMTFTGKMIFGFGCGLITLSIRQFGGMPEGTAFSILTMNLLTPSIDKLTRPKPFGMKKDITEKNDSNEKNEKKVIIINNPSKQSKLIGGLTTLLLGLLGIVYSIITITSNDYVKYYGFSGSAVGDWLKTAEGIVTIVIGVISIILFTIGGFLLLSLKFKRVQKGKIDE